MDELVWMLTGCSDAEEVEGIAKEITERTGYPLSLPRPDAGCTDGGTRPQLTNGQKRALIKKLGEWVLGLLSTLGDHSKPRDVC